jgi:hypothetical protein
MQAITRRYIVAAVLLAASVVAASAIRHVRDADPGYMPTFASLPKHIGEYTCHELPVQASVLHFLQPDAIRTVEYRALDANPPWVDVSVIYGKDWRPIHSPLHCLAADGWAIGTQEEVAISVPDGPQKHQEIVAKRLRADKQGKQLAVLYALAHIDGTTSSWPRFAYEVATGRAGAGGVILLMRAPVVGESSDRAPEVLAECMAVILPACVDFWYETKPDP